MRRKIGKLLLLAVFLLPLTIHAQVLEPVKWSFSKKELEQNKYELTFKAEIEKNWHLYDLTLPEGNISLPTVFTFKNSDGVELIDSIQRKSEVLEEMDELAGVMTRYYANEAVFSQVVEISEPEDTVKVSVEFMVCDDEQCLPPTEETHEYTFTEDKAQGAATPAKKDDSSLIGFFLLAFVGGLLAILTPCVFPMIPMTVSFFMHSGDNKAKSKFQATVFGLSIIGIYTIIGTIVAITLGPSFANWLSTHWLPNILFFVIFWFFAASFFGMFELTLPSWMVNKSDKQADKGGVGGAFFMALTLVLVSFSCTAPIVGTILVESAGGQVLKPITGMLGFALAFALPFGFFAFFPRLLSNMPKSGGWLNSVKVILGFIELALGLKFLSVADMTYHWGLLDRDIYIALWIVIFSLMGFYLLGKIRFAHDSEVKHISVPRLLLVIVTFTFVVYMIPGLWGAPLKALSGYLPPMKTHDFDVQRVVRDNVKLYAGSVQNTNGQNQQNNMFQMSGTNSEACEDPKYADFLELPHGLEGYFDYEQGMACAKAQNKPVFIDFTGHGCVNCREMEANVWSDPRVQKILRDEYVIIALYVDDKKKLPEEDWYTSEYDGKLKNTIGKKYADFQISRFNVNAQPYYVLLDHDEEMLTEPRAYNLDVEAFIDFLETGIKNFKSKQ
ncbi:Thiol:disulfide interchange protein DsbD precursor [Salinivirga cyanobacteriivorans]|uniref:Thiol:disulfide interchange protein DsbD n=1 Tax=Salinivirga cyanobacteriivorans TaxID=1307839 RepID=A0A0S2I361_9BACT|nr:cytochrome c biogenesis protein CcdA [Salinivirga cyanobacteriivorans]ALO16851.1 Thiol:disulfide interchange protein DsbD precursor [Salinivirga cyanobacteriivorans]